MAWVLAKACQTLSKMISPKSQFLLASFVFCGIGAFAQGGNVTTAHGSGTYTPFLDPNSNGWITTSGAAFTSTTTELAEFEAPTGSVTGWKEITDVSENGSDITPTCSLTDIAKDGNGGGIGYFNIVDPTPANTANADAYLVLRMRLADVPNNGNWGFNFLISTDGLYGQGSDPNAVAGNRGFEYEVQYTSGGSSKGVSGWNINGLIAPSTINCNKCVAFADVQMARAAVAGGCSSGTPTFVTFALPLSNLGIPSNTPPANLFFGMGTAANGNNTSLLGGSSVKDYGGFNDSAVPTACSGFSGAALFDCLYGQAYNTFNPPLPVTLGEFVGTAAKQGNQLSWTAYDERAFAGYDLQTSTDGKTWKSLAWMPARGMAGRASTYDYLHTNAGSMQYYRFQARDLDGVEKASPTIAVRRGLSSASVLRVSPNPARGDVFVDLDGLTGGDAAHYSITDATGRVIAKGLLSEPHQRVELGFLPAGVYAVTAAAGDAVLSTRLVLE